MKFAAGLAALCLLPGLVLAQSSAALDGRLKKIRDTKALDDDTAKELKDALGEPFGLKEVAALVLTLSGVALALRKIGRASCRERVCWIV